MSNDMKRQSPLQGGLWKFEKLRQNQPLSKKFNDQLGKEYEILASDVISEARTRGKHNEPGFLRFEPEMKATIRNSSSHLSCLKLLGRK